MTDNAVTASPSTTPTTAATLSDAKKLMQYDANKKSTLVSYLLWFFFGWFGVHRFYLGLTGSGVTILLLSVVGVALSVFGVGLVILLVAAIWLFVDLFLIPGMVRDKNNKLIQSIS